MKDRKETEFCNYQALKGLELPADFNGVIKLDPDYFICNDLGFLTGLAGEFLLPALGHHITNDAITTRVFAFELKRDPTGGISEDDAQGVSRNFGMRTQLFLLGLWAVRDNSITPTHGYLVLLSPKGVGLVTDPWGLIYSTATRGVQWTIYTPDEIREAWKLSDDILALVPKGKLDELPMSSLTHGNRFSRAISFSQAARTTNDLAIKIAFYCMAFEALVSTDVAGVAHQVSERSALLIGTDGADQQAIYDDIKRLYVLRSKAVHGAVVSFKGDDSDLQRIQSGDEYLRRAVRKIVDTPDLITLFTKAKEEDVTAFFMNKIFPR